MSKVIWDGQWYQIGKGTIIDGETMYGDRTLIVESVKEMYDKDTGMNEVHISFIRGGSVTTKNRQLIFEHFRPLGIRYEGN